jgi:hypothetical protein
VTGRNVFLGQPAATQDLKGSELIERMQANPLVIFRKRVVLGETLVANDARNRLRFRHALLLQADLRVSAPYVEAISRTKRNRRRPELRNVVRLSHIFEHSGDALGCKQRREARS